MKFKRWLNENMNRRNFLKVAGGTALSYLGANNNPAQADDFDELQKIPKTNNPGVDQEYDYLLYKLYPRNQQELQQLKAFFSYVYSSGTLRKKVMESLTQPVERLEAEYKRFLIKYTGGKMPNMVRADNTTADRDKKQITWNQQQVSGQLNFPSSMVARHELDHLRQGPHRIDNENATRRLNDNPEKFIEESLAALYDICSLVIVDQEILKQQNQNVFKDETGRPRYTMKIDFPSGQQMTLMQLSNMAKTGGVVDVNNPKYAMKILSKYASFIESLIYGHNDREDNNAANNETPEFYKSKLPKYYNELQFAQFIDHVKKSTEMQQILTRQGVNINDLKSMRAFYNKTYLSK